MPETEPRHKPEYKFCNPIPKFVPKHGLVPHCSITGLNLADEHLPNQGMYAYSVTLVKNTGYLACAVVRGVRRMCGLWMSVCPSLFPHLTPYTLLFSCWRMASQRCSDGPTQRRPATFWADLHRLAERTPGAGRPTHLHLWQQRGALVLQFALHPWHRLPQMDAHQPARAPAPLRRTHTTVLYRHKLYLVGEDNDVEALNDAWSLDMSVPVEGMRWELLKTHGERPVSYR
jgi:hypothetical protein